MWAEILTGIASMILNPWLGIIFFQVAGFSFIFTFCLLIIREIVYLVLVYRGFSWVVLMVEKTEKITGKLVNWITGRSREVCCILAFVPFVPYLSTSMMISVKLMKIRYGFMILCAAMLFKAFICCSVIYFFL
jgi:hypothetical protein